MRLDYTQVFLKEVKSIKSVSIKERIEKAIKSCKDVNSLKDI